MRQPYPPDDEQSDGDYLPRRNAAVSEHLPQKDSGRPAGRPGGSNREVGAQLFLSPRTVANHPYKALSKLGITSHAELGRLDLDELAARSTVTAVPREMSTFAYRSPLSSDLGCGGLRAR
jgi:Bacterial regulatory proteins, luxR family